MKKYQRFRTRFLPLLAIFIFTILLFSYSVSIRQPWFGELAEGNHSWLTGVTIKFAKNWYYQDPIALYFGMYEAPLSIENPTLEMQYLYPSYPPAAILPAYLMSIISGKPPGPEMVMIINLINHFLIAFSLGLIAYLILTFYKMPKHLSVLYSFIPVSIILLFPITLYYFQNVYFTDMAVILPVTVFLLLDIIKWHKYSERINKICSIIQVFVIFFGVLTEWFFLFFLVFWYLGKILSGEQQLFTKKFYKHSLVIWAPAILALTLYVYQLSAIGALEQLKNKFLWRSGMEESMCEVTLDWFNHRVWRTFVKNGFGPFGEVIIKGSIAFALIAIVVLLFYFFRKKQTLKINKAFSTAFALSIAPLFQTYLFKCHSNVHDFSILKFCLPFSLVPFIIIPLVVFILLKQFRIKNIKKLKEIAALSLFAVTGFYVAAMHANYSFYFPESNPEYRTVGNFINENTGYNDVVFSPGFTIPLLPPQQISYSMKMVHDIHSSRQIMDKLAALPDSAVVNIFYPAFDHTKVPKTFNFFQNHADTVTSKSMALFKIPKPKFVELFKRFEAEQHEIFRNYRSETNPIQLFKLKAELGIDKRSALYDSLIQKIKHNIPAFSIIKDSLALLDYNVKSTDKKNEYQLELLFNSIKMEKDWAIFLHLTVEDALKDQLLNAKDGIAYRDFSPQPPTTEWPENQLTLITTTFQANPIPHFASIGFYNFNVIGEFVQFGNSNDLGIFNL